MSTDSPAKILPQAYQGDQIGHVELPTDQVELQKLSECSEKVGHCVAGVFQQKATNKKECESGISGRFFRFNPFLIGGDIFTFGYLGLQAATVFKPSLANITAVSSTMFICGEISGVIMLGIGVFDLITGIKKAKNGDKGHYGTILILTGLSEIALGLLLIVSSLCAKFFATGAVATFFAANPWLIPLLFLIPSIFSLIEICKKLNLIRTGQDIASKFKYADIRNAIKEYTSNNPVQQNGLEGNVMSILPRATSEQKIVTSFETFISNALGIEFKNLPDDSALRAQAIMNQIYSNLRDKIIAEENIKVRNQVEQLIKKHAAEGKGKIFERNNIEYLLITLPETKIVLVAKTQNEPAIEVDLSNITLTCQITRGVFKDKYTIVSDIDSDAIQEKCRQCIEANFDLFNGKYISERVEIMAENMGVEAAIRAGSLINPMIQILKAIGSNNHNRANELITNKLGPSKRNLTEQIKTLQENKRTWTKLLMWRLAVQLFYVAAFGASMGTIAMKPSIQPISTGAQNVILAIPNAIAFIIDTFYPYLRGMPLVPSDVEVTQDNATELVEIGSGKEVTFEEPPPQ